MKYSTISTVILFSLCCSACSGSVERAVEQTVAAQVAIQQTVDGFLTQQAAQITASADTPTPTVAEPTFTPEPDITIAPPTQVIANRERISFPQGGTMAIFSAGVAPEQPKGYVIGAAKDQWLMVDITSATKDVFFTITSVQTGAILVRATDKVLSYRTILPANGDYNIDVIAMGSAAANYNLSVYIPARILFDAGANSKTIDGVIVPNTVVTHILRASIGQTLKVNLSSQSGKIGMSIFALENNRQIYYLSQGASDWSGVLPTGDDYIINLIANGNSNETYRLTVSVK